MNHNCHTQFVLFQGCKISAYVNHDIVTEIPGQPPRILGTGLHVGERRARPTRKLFEMALSDVNNAGRMVLGNVGPLARQDSRQGTPNTPWNQDLSTTASTMARHTPYGHDRLTTPPQGRSPGINVVPGVGVWYEGTYTNRSKDFGFIKSPAFPARDVYVSDTSIRGLMPKEGQIVKFRVTDATPGSDSTMGNVASECRILDLSTSGSPIEGEVDELRWFLGEYAVRKENYGFIRCPQFFGRDVYVPDNMILQQRTPEMPMPTDYAGKMVEFRVSSKPEGGGTAATNQFKAIDIRMPQQAIPLLSHGGSTASISPVPSFGNQNSLSSIAGSLQPPASNLPSRNNSGHLGPHPVGSPSPIPSIGRSTPPGRDRSRSPRREGSGVKGPLDAFSKSSADVGMLLEERQTGKGRYRCKVVHWNNDKDYGFIDWGDSENQAHISIHAIRPLGRNKLYRGDVLDCDILERPCGGKFYCDTNNVVFVRHDHQ